MHEQLERGHHAYGEQVQADEAILDESARHNQRSAITKVERMSVELKVGCFVAREAPLAECVAHRAQRVDGHLRRRRAFATSKSSLAIWSGSGRQCGPIEAHVHVEMSGQRDEASEAKTHGAGDERLLDATGDQP